MIYIEFTVHLDTDSLKMLMDITYLYYILNPYPVISLCYKYEACTSMQINNKVVGHVDL